MSTPLLRQLRILEASTDAFLARRSTSFTAEDRAQRTYSLIRSLASTNSSCSALAPTPHDGHWPYLPSRYDEPNVMRYDALVAMVEACGHRLLVLFRDTIGTPPELPSGGIVPLYFAKDDAEPLISFWFEPTSHSALV
ncbi:hypothetical protein QCE73_08905 [Caballeronia sp. LZ029]|uniref:hypothetical protein n=1 Tax=Caballeronia sp. LZ029 TaxID=3038564 RepID=UPI00285D6AF4|nr:hypothetical protein [Caballeronia sp. LZ029]MDR5743272.1 hypothetical protein [Caballeronia sp. LZ029]